jgi:hypothetical protein
MAKCQCGCGSDVSIAKRSNPRLGHVKGQPVRFLPGHHRRGASPPLEERFRSRVAVTGPDDCWEWTAGRVPAGYGAVWDNSIGRHRHTHRLAWELKYGPIPEGLFVCHRCDNPSCCNPAHLFLGTQQDNDRDRTQKGRSSRGERHPDAKLTDVKVREARKRWAQGESVSTLASECGVAFATMSAALKRQTWRHVA